MEIFKTIAEALDKQVEKEPLCKEMERGPDFHFCPVCQKGLVPHSGNYCKFCGQRIKW